MALLITSEKTPCLIPNGEESKEGKNLREKPKSRWLQSQVAMCQWIKGRIWINKVKERGGSLKKRISKIRSKRQEMKMIC